MEKRIQSKIKMLLLCKQLLESKSEICQQLPACKEQLSELEHLISQILTTADFLFGKRLAAKQKQENLNKLIELAYSVSSKIHAFACISGNNMLKLDSAITPTKLRYCSALDTLHRAQHIYANALQQANLLKPYGLSSEMLQNLEQAIAHFKESIPEPHIERALRKVQKENLKNTIEQAIAILQTIDKLVELVRFTEPEFYNSYQAARRIQVSMQPLAAIGFVQNSNSGKALSNVKLSIFELETEKPMLEQYSAKQGGFRIKELNSGNYTLVASMPGYKSCTLSFTISKHNTQRLNIKMKQL